MIHFRKTLPNTPKYSKSFHLFSYYFPPNMLDAFNYPVHAKCPTHPHLINITPKNSM